MDEPRLYGRQRESMCVYLVKTKDIRIVKLLLDAKANIEAKDKSGQTPLSWAAEEGHVDVVKLLLKAKANIEAEDKVDKLHLLGGKGRARGCGEVIVEGQSKHRGGG